MIVIPEDAAIDPAAPLRVRVPLLIEVTPVWRLFPVRVSPPSPFFVKPPVVATEAPDIVSVLAAVVTSIVAVVPLLIVKFRSVLAPAPVYCRVPLSKTRLAAALEAWPRLPATPPLPIVATLITPEPTVVTPV